MKRPQTGAPGLSGDQVQRVLIVNQMNGFSNEELSFHVADSVSYRSFCRFGALDRVLSRSTLAENLKKVRPQTLEQAQRLLLRYESAGGAERGEPAHACIWLAKDEREDVTGLAELSQSGTHIATARGRRGV